MKTLRSKPKEGWMVNKSIRFDPKKLKEAQEKGVLKDLPNKCRKQLDALLKVK